ncbi:MAG: hypothetical protein ACLSAF_07420 [Intestinimonas sp.]
MALLFIALCRIAGVPARWESGLSVRPDHVGPHDSGPVLRPALRLAVVRLFLRLFCSAEGGGPAAGALFRQPGPLADGGQPGLSGPPDAP